MTGENDVNFLHLRDSNLEFDDWCLTNSEGEYFIFYILYTSLPFLSKRHLVRKFILNFLVNLCIFIVHKYINVTARWKVIYLKK